MAVRHIKATSLPPGRHVAHAAASRHLPNAAVCVLIQVLAHRFEATTAPDNRHKACGGRARARPWRCPCPFPQGQRLRTGPIGAPCQQHRNGLKNALGVAVLVVPDCPHGPDRRSRSTAVRSNAIALPHRMTPQRWRMRDDCYANTTCLGTSRGTTTHTSLEPSTEMCVCKSVANLDERFPYRRFRALPRCTWDGRSNWFGVRPAKCAQLAPNN